MKLLLYHILEKHKDMNDGKFLIYLDAGCGSKITKKMALDKLFYYHIIYIKIR